MPTKRKHIENVIERRKRLHLSRRALAEMTTLTQSQIWRVEKYEAQGVTELPERQSLLYTLTAYEQEVIKQLGTYLEK